VQKDKCTKSQILVRLDIDRYSFSNRVINEWNALNDEIIESIVHYLLLKAMGSSEESFCGHYAWSWTRKSILYYESRQCCWRSKGKKLDGAYSL